VARVDFVRAVRVTEAHKHWWRERFTRDEILWMADALFGEDNDVQVSEPTGAQSATSALGTRDSLYNAVIGTADFKPSNVPA
jgi:hypothetical protein